MIALIAPIGMATISSITGIAEEEKAVKTMPWNVIMMVCGVSMLMELANLFAGGAAAMVFAINVGAHVVDASPLSIGGALYIACAADWVDKKKMLKQLMLWGLSMSVVGAITVWLFFAVFNV